MDVISRDSRLLITGGSGFIGTNAMEWAILRSIKVVNLDITPPRNPEHMLYWREVDIRVKDAFMDALSEFNPTHILHLAATTGMDIKDMSVLDANTIGVQNLIDISAELKELKRIVFTSSLLVCENGYIPTSDTDYNPPNLYGKSKMIGEQLVRAAGMNCEWVIVRPTSIWGPWFEHSYKSFFKTIDNNRYMHIGYDEFQKPASFVGNTVHMMIDLLYSEVQSVSGSTYYLADYPWYSTRKWANSIQQILSSKPVPTAPMWFLKLLGNLGDAIKIITKYDPPLTTFRLNNMLTGGSYPVDNTKAICGELPHDLNDSVFQTAKWMYHHDMIKHEPRDIKK
jgi:GlcNAc-P-P-Und epimerase